MYIMFRRAFFVVCIPDGLGQAHWPLVHPLLLFELPSFAVLLDQRPSSDMPSARFALGYGYFPALWLTCRLPVAVTRSFRADSSAYLATCANKPALLGLLLGVFQASFANTACVCRLGRISRSDGPRRQLE